MAGEASRDLLTRLADGRCHSGAELGAALGRSRAAIWKQVQALRALGLPVSARQGLGYSLPAPLELLSADLIRSRLGPGLRPRLAELGVVFQVDSTSRRLLDEPPPPPGTYRVLLAEYQTGGRGRRGRRWLSPPCSGLCGSLSLLWETPPRDLAALGLVTGVAVAEAVDSLGARGVGLKWPNDVVATGGKLAGILVDVAGEPAGPLKVVIGVGINVHSSPDLATAVQADGESLPPVALDRIVAGPPVSRNALASALLESLDRALLEFARDGFLPFADRWRRLDWLHGQPVSVVSGQGRVAGVARGIGPDGALLLEQGGHLLPVLAGDVSVRRTP